MLIFPQLRFDPLKRGNFVQISFSIIKTECSITHPYSTIFFILQVRLYWSMGCGYYFYFVVYFTFPFSNIASGIYLFIERILLTYKQSIENMSEIMPEFNFLYYGLSKFLFLAAWFIWPLGNRFMIQKTQYTYRK